MKHCTRNGKLDTNPVARFVPGRVPHDAVSDSLGEIDWAVARHRKEDFDVFLVFQGHPNEIGTSHRLGDGITCRSPVPWSLTGALPARAGRSRAASANLLSLSFVSRSCLAAVMAGERESASKAHEAEQDGGRFGHRRLFEDGRGRDPTAHRIEIGGAA